jgi:hypothetical protein
VPDDWQAVGRITNSLGETDYATSWAGEYNRTDGVTGMYLPEEDHMAVDRRTVAHHNQQYRTLVDYHDRNPSPIMAWAWTLRGRYADGERVGTAADLEFPRSRGGIVQVLDRIIGGDDVVVWNTGTQVDQYTFYQVIYTCRLLDCPGNTKVATKWVPREVKEDSGMSRSRKREFEVTRGRYRLKDCYAELRFQGRLPEPRVERDLEVDDPWR